MGDLLSADFAAELRRRERRNVLHSAITSALVSLLIVGAVTRPWAASPVPHPREGSAGTTHSDAGASPYSRSGRKLQQACTCTAVGDIGGLAFAPFIGKMAVAGSGIIFNVPVTFAVGATVTAGGLNVQTGDVTFQSGTKVKITTGALPFTVDGASGMTVSGPGKIVLNSAISVEATSGTSKLVVKTDSVEVSSGV